MLRSAILPGFGQFYNHSYWKIPIIYGTAAYFVYRYKVNNDKFHEYSDKYETEKLTGNVLNNTLEIYKYQREFYRDNRDSYIWYLSVLYLVNILDAYVGAHLFDFNINEDVSMNSLPGFYSIKFKINF